MKVSHETCDIAVPQPPPKQSDAPAIWDLVIERMKARDKMGQEKYGTSLKAFNGRDSLVDARQELYDLIVYFEQHEYEKAEMAKILRESMRLMQERGYKGPFPHELFDVVRWLEGNG